MTAKPTLFLCSCDNSQKIDAKAIGEALELGATPKVYEQLCRAQLDALNTPAAANAPAVICCTQESPILIEAWDEAGGTDASPVFVNIREQAGWSDEGPKAAAKMAALIAESQIEVAGSPIVSLSSEGRTLVLGRDDSAIAAAKRLAAHLDVTVCLDGAHDIMPPALGDVAIFNGKVVGASGHLGAFSIMVERLAALTPTSRGEARFGAKSDGTETLSADVIIDLRGDTPLFPAPEKRDGYLRVDAGNPAQVERALFDALNLVGEFEKPRYVNHASTLCAHSRNSIVACTRCIDTCPTSAITPAGDHVAIDPYVCAGCGECSQVCPTGANSYQFPAVKGVLARARALLETYRKAKGTDPIVLASDATFGVEATAMMARYGRGLPANVLPLTLNNVTSLGLDTLLSLCAYGASRAIVLADPNKGDELSALRDQASLANTILDGLGYGANRVLVIEEADPTAVETLLWDQPKLAPIKGAVFLVEGAKRETLSLALGHLHAQAPTPQDRVSLPQGSPFGAVRIDEANCTLCLACTSACPTSALKSNPDRPELRFRENACVQCGLCQKT
ncbi:MAG TPA: 4Fe-4S binding protein, partial [Magnetovibrio sp.]